jgi:GIY-YIG catalytic domain
LAKANETNVGLCGVLVSMTDIQQQAYEILDRLIAVPFEQCFPIGRSFPRLPRSPGIYGIRHQRGELLYLGKTNDLSTRFNGGHKAFTWSWLDLYQPSEVRIAIAPLDRWGNPALLLEVEGILLRATEPPYNVKIPLQP